jgi:hypothetical protein
MMRKRMQMLEKINQEIEGMICEIEMQEPISIIGKINILILFI